MKYLHQHGKHTWHLDHRLVPEVRAMFTAMSSRMPVGGLVARYTEVVEAVWARAVLHEEGRQYHFGDHAWRPLPAHLWRGEKESHEHHNSRVSPHIPEMAEDRLCEYPLHPRVQAFFDKFVAAYGHSSVLELTGSPATYVGGLSWWGAYLLFDSPLVTGQENSTRAVTRRGWPMAMECYSADGDPHPLLKELNDIGMRVFEAEVAAWKTELRKPCSTCRGSCQVVGGQCPDCNLTGRKYPWMKDPQAFRPALDRARWALPGTISTGAGFTSHVRERARVIRNALAFAQGSDQATKLFEEIKDCYRAATPGIGSLGLREAVYTADKLVVPEHLAGVHANFSRFWAPPFEPEVFLDLRGMITGPERAAPRTYADASWNHARVDTFIQCSLAVSRDWHRHRTFYPWKLNLVRRKEAGFLLDSHYKPISDLGLKMAEVYFQKATAAYDHFVSVGDHYRAMLCLPFGTAVQMFASPGLRDFLYTMELRAFSHGANFEYEEQAKLMLTQLVEQLGPLADHLKISPPE
jgi:hypothetical protein